MKLRVFDHGTQQEWMDTGILGFEIHLPYWTAYALRRAEV